MKFIGRKQHENIYADYDTVDNHRQGLPGITCIIQAKPWKNSKECKIENSLYGNICGIGCLVGKNKSGRRKYNKKKKADTQNAKKYIHFFPVLVEPDK
jgi:hypothetical protein